MNAPDVVIPYKLSLADEISYMLRSLKNISHGQVFIIGDRLKLSNKATYIPFKQSMDIAQNTLDIMNIACSDERIADKFYFWHDDTYLMKPLKSIPVLHRGSYRTIIDSYPVSRRFGYYIKRMTATHNRLIAMGIKAPLCYELHIPTLISKKKWNEVSRYITKDLNKISMYGNLNNIGGTYMKDVKVRSKDWVPAGYFISTHDSTFGSKEAGRLVRDTFPDKSEYEK